VEIRRFAENNLKAKALHTNLEGHFVTLCNHVPLSISLRSRYFYLRHVTALNVKLQWV